MWRAAHALLDRHPFVLPWAAVAIAWAPTFIASVPGLFMGRYGRADPVNGFNLPNGTSDYLNLINPNVLLNGHHRVVHTALLGGCVQLGHIAVWQRERGRSAVYDPAVRGHDGDGGVRAVEPLSHGGGPRRAHGRARVLHLRAHLLKLCGTHHQRRAVRRRVRAACRPDGKLLVPAGGTSSKGKRVRTRRGACASMAPAGTGRCWCWHRLAVRILRNGGLVFPAIACILIAGFRIAAASSPRRCGRSRVLAVTVAAYLAFTGIAMPAPRHHAGQQRARRSPSRFSKRRAMCSNTTASMPAWRAGPDDGHGER